MSIRKKRFLFLLWINVLCLAFISQSVPQTEAAVPLKNQLYHFGTKLYEPKNKVLNTLRTAPKFSHLTMYIAGSAVKMASYLAKTASRPLKILARPAYNKLKLRYQEEKSRLPIETPLKYASHHADVALASKKKTEDSAFKKTEIEKAHSRAKEAYENARGVNDTLDHGVEKIFSQGKKKFHNWRHEYTVHSENADHENVDFYLNKAHEQAKIFGSNTKRELDQIQEERENNRQKIRSEDARNAREQELQAKEKSLKGIRDEQIKEVRALHQKYPTNQTSRIIDALNGAEEEMAAAA
jgi:hypothetical protein